MQIHNICMFYVCFSYSITPPLELSRANCVPFHYLYKEKLTLYTILLYDELIVLFTDVYVILLRVVCQKLLQKREKKRKPCYNQEC